MSDIYDGNGNVITVSDMSEFDIPIDVFGLPKVYIESDSAYSELSSTKTNGTLTYIDGEKKFELPIQYKIQGNASTLLDKKNLNVTFYENDTYESKQKIRFGSWYPTKKVHIKANEQEYSMCRNSVATNIFYEWMGRNLPNGARGYVDSFPVILYFNDEWLGCYTINLPQDGDLFNFKSSKETSCKHLAYRIETVTNMSSVSGWEYRGDEDVTTDMDNAFQAVLDVLYNTDNLTTEMVEAVIDKDSLLNYLMCCQIGYAVDNVHNNQTLATWDGAKWYYIFYDLDGCFGTGQGGAATNSTTNLLNNSGTFSNNAFFVKCLDLYADEFASYYSKIRSRYDIPTYVSEKFYEFQNKWGIQNIEDDRTKWADDKPTERDVDIIYDWLTSRIEYLDTLYEYSS